VDIVGHFVDCRTDSPTCGVQVSVQFAASPIRKLVIPRGVAHSFDNLERVVTRDEPVWYSDHDNPSWNIDNDLVSFSRSTPPERAPTIRPNRYRLNGEAHRFMSRLSQSLLENPIAYLNRIRVQLGQQAAYVVLEPKTWLDDDREIQAQLVQTVDMRGVELRKNRYALTGQRSWTLVPNTESCVADILELRPSRRSDMLFCHARTKKLYTFMNAEGAPVRITLLDARAGSDTEGRLEHVQLSADPRICVVIPNGVAYRIDTEAPLLVRCEHVVFVDEAEPRNDIPMFGEDLLCRTHAEVDAGWRVSIPTVECPPIVVYELARVESIAS
jgi:dTDP-4-dehydrorhamnose 3,5-epimerase-like enzyme